jgi:hypothetical protein
VNRYGALVLLTTDAIRARRHPWALAGLWGWQTVLALGVSWPATSLVRAVYGVGPRGDAPLWDAGGHAMLDFLWRSGRGLSPVAGASELVLVVGAVAGLLPMATAMFAMAYATRDSPAAGFMRSIGGALRAMPSLLLLLLVVGLTQAAAAGVGFVVAETVEAWAHPALGEARAERMGIAVGLIFVALVSGLGVMHDLARAVVVRSRASAFRALVLGARTFGRAPLPIWWSWAWRGLLSLAPVLGAAALATRIGGRGGVALLLLAFLHQTVVLSRVALHASWLAEALRSIDRPATEPAPYRADSDR